MTSEQTTTLAAASGSETLEFRVPEGKSREELIRMFLGHEQCRWEKLPADGWSIEDLDENEIRTAVQEAIMEYRLAVPGSEKLPDLLRSLGLLGKEDCLPRAAVVLFGKTKRIESDMPQCLLRVARFRGSNEGELDNQRFYGNAFKLLKDAERFLSDALPVAGRLEPDRSKRINEPFYPQEAVREALVNALCHRDYAADDSIRLAVYDDRMEIASPGPLRFEWTPEDLFAPHPPRPLNPLIARTFYCRGIIEQLGIGIPKMVQAMGSSGLPHPEIESDEIGVTVRFRHREYMEIKL